MTDLDLQLKLAKMLPEKLFMGIDGFVRWQSDNFRVKDTEWLHVCWLVETSLEYEDWCLYVQALGEVTRSKQHVGWITPCNFVTASWQQRAEALCKVKGVER